MFKKPARFLLVLLLLIVLLPSCLPWDRTEDNTSSNAATTDPFGGELSETDTITPPVENETDHFIHGIKPVDFPDPSMISEYDTLTEDQKIAFDALGAAFKDILQNGPTVGKTYPLQKRIDWLDYKMVYNLFAANYPVTGDIWKEIGSADSLGTTDYVDSIYLYDDDISLLEESYQKYLEVDEEADKILASIDHDGTEYGKALSIATWMVDNIVYPSDYQERMDNGESVYLNSVYAALINHEAVCGGYAKTYDLLCKKAGLETILVNGEARESHHLWNMICIDEKWYHVDVTWMDDGGDFYGNFMMPDNICNFFGHGQAEYYWNQKTNEIITPVAESYDLYSYCYKSCEDMIAHYKHSVEISKDQTYLAVLLTESPERVEHFNGSEIVSDVDGVTYYIKITEQETNVYNVSFIQKRE